MKKLVVLAVLAVIVLIIGVVFFNLPQRIGLTRSPAEKLLKPELDNITASAMMKDLKSAGVNTQGMD
ncbi:MAG: hypothetical protein U1B77_04765, partial [Dehalococcoidales bacterium]|nr:hypothetical protein [Dehalococcoidales bacterium]